MTIRVLVVDDHESWRRHISAAVLQRFRSSVVYHAADGLDAIQKAARLKPDLILLDVGLPTLNGIEVARRILASTPDARILFVSEQRSSDVAAAAMATGACGYVLKSDAARELLPAIGAVVAGDSFIGARFAGVSARTTAARAIGRTPRHEMRFYSDESSLLNGYGRFTEAALEIGSAAIVVSTAARRLALHQRFQASGLDVDRAIEEGRYVSLDVADTLALFMADGCLDEARFRKAATDLVVAAARASRRPQPRVVACGECAPTLLKEGKAEAAIQLEHLWDDLARAHGVDILCGYPLQAPGCDEERRMLDRICEQHSVVRAG